MSLLYEALQKARNEKQKSPPKKLVRKPTRKKQLESYKVEEEQLQSKLQILTEANHKKSKVPFFMNLGIFVLFSMGVIVFFYFNQNDIADFLASRKVAQEKFVETSVSQSNAVESSTRKPRSVAIIAPSNQDKASKKSSKNSSYQREVSLPEFKCTGVVLDDHGNYCFINGYIARVGDQIAGAYLLKIEAKAVYLSYEGEEFRIPLNGTPS